MKKVGDKMIAGIEVNLSLILNIIRTIIDLLLVWYILYLGISMFKQNMRTMQLFKGVLHYLKKWDKLKEIIIWNVYQMIKRNIC